MKISRRLAVYLLVAALPVFAFRAYGEEPGRTEQETLSAQLLERWDQTPLPEWLASKKAQIDEVMGTGELMALEDLRLMLAADDEKNIVRNSSLIDLKVYSSLQTQSGFKYLLKNLKEGELRPRANEERYSRFGVYLMLHLKATPRPFEWSDTELHFSPEILDRTDYHVNPSWAYGNYNPDSASPAVSPGRTNFMFGRLLKKSEKNEIVFHSAVSLKSLVKIVVPTGRKKKLLAQIAKEKIACPVAIGWDNLISEQPLPAKKPQEPSSGPTD